MVDGGLRFCSWAPGSPVPVHWAVTGGFCSLCCEMNRRIDPTLEITLGLLLYGFAARFCTSIFVGRPPRSCSSRTPLSVLLLILACYTHLRNLIFFSSNRHISHIRAGCPLALQGEVAACRCRRSCCRRVVICFYLRPGCMLPRALRALSRACICCFVARWAVVRYQVLIGSAAPDQAPPRARWVGRWCAEEKPLLVPYRRRAPGSGSNAIACWQRVGDRKNVCLCGAERHCSE